MCTLPDDSNRSRSSDRLEDEKQITQVPEIWAFSAKEARMKLIEKQNMFKFKLERVFKLWITPTLRICLGTVSSLMRDGKNPL